MTLVGSKILHYRILSEIGAGGMGIVYLAEDEKLHRQVALKFVAKSIQDNPDARDRLIREARAASALNHPNIVSIHAIEETPEHVFIVMEYVEGDSIHAIVKRRELTWERALELAPQILSALAAAHEHGVVHRDIKSDNIILTAKGQIKVLDFGLARGRDAAAFKTRVGSSAGTPAYMSPEHIQGGEVDQRSDLFSFGVVFYEMLTGRMPFKGEHEAALTYSIVNETPTEVRVHNAAVPPALQNVVAKLLQKNPRERYQNAGEVVADLHRIAEGKRVSAPRSRSGLFAAVAVVVVVGALAAWFLRGRSAGDHDAAADADANRKMLAVLPFENLGPEDQEYFADGVTEEITTQLAKLSGLGVISRTSAMKFKGSQKSLRDIGKELGVDYALEGSVRWDKSGDQNNVRISTQLIRISDDTHLWADNFDRVYDQIFVLQSEIAHNVAEALNITLLEPDRAALATKPTENFDAYDLFLKGREQHEHAKTPPDVNAAVALVEQAVKLDSTFTKAQAWLARTYANQYFNRVHKELPRLAQARQAALVALRHAPDQPQGHIAMGYYYYYGSRDYDRALKEFAIAEKMQPNNAEVLEAMGYVQRRQGKWDESVKNLERAVDLDPKTASRIGNLALTYQYLRRWDDVERCVARGKENAVPGDPTFAIYHAFVLLSRDGNAAGAQAIIEPLAVQVPQLNSFLAQMDVVQRNYSSVHKRYRHLGQYAGQDTSDYYVQRGTAYWFAGDKDRGRTYFDSLRVYLENSQHVKTTDNAQVMMGYALTLGCTERKAEATRYADKAVETLPLSRDAISGSDLLFSQMILHIILEENDRAIREIEYLMSIPSTMTPAILRIHPGFDTLRDDPRFKKLAEEKISS